MIRNFIALIVTSYFFISSCNVKKGDCETEYNLLGQIQSQGCSIHNLKYGTWKYFYPGGQIHLIVHYTNGIEDGPHLEFNKNGKIYCKATFNNGNFYGAVDFYYPNGKLNYEEFYDKKGVTQGDFKLLYQSGRLSQEAVLLNGKIIGQSKQYFENGSIKSIFKYDSLGRKNGIWKYFSPNGTVIKHEEYKLDSLVKKK